MRFIGVGIKAKSTIPKGAFVMEYVGEVLTTEEYADLVRRIHCIDRLRRAQTGLSNQFSSLDDTRGCLVVYTFSNTTHRK